MQLPVIHVVPYMVRMDSQMPDWRAAVPGLREELQGGMINFVGDVGGGGQGFLVGAG